MLLRADARPAFNDDFWHELITRYVGHVADGAIMFWTPVAACSTPRREEKVIRSTGAQSLEENAKCAPAFDPASGRFYWLDMVSGRWSRTRLKTVRGDGVT